MIMTHNQPAGDHRLRLHHAKQLRNRMPHLSQYGTKQGCMRSWVKLLEERKRNLSRTATLGVRAQSI